MTMRRGDLEFEVERVCGRWVRATLRGKWEKTRLGLVLFPVGNFDALGGFLHEKDFDFYFAARCAIDNVLSQYRRAA